MHQPRGALLVADQNVEEARGGAQSDENAPSHAGTVTSQADAVTVTAECECRRGQPASAKRVTVTTVTRTPSRTTT